DLYIERINPDNPNQYEFRGEWRDMEVRTEILEAPGREPVELEVRSTHHGPIISEVFEDLEDFNLRSGVRVPEHYAIALSWTALQPTGVIDTIMGLNRASNWEEFRTALASFHVPGQNFVYADRDGNIGYQSTGIVPVRAAGDGTVPVPGWTGEYEWTGFVLLDQLPRAFNPPEGYVFTANNRPAGDSYPHQLSTMWAYGYRAQRISDMLEAAPRPLEPSYLRLMQADARDLFAEVLVPYLLDVVPSSDLARQGQALLGEWGDSGAEVFDPSYQMRPESAAAAVYASVWSRLLTISIGDELGGEFTPEGGSRWFEVMTDLLGDPEHPWWDYQFTEEIETRDEILLRALEEGMALTSGNLGSDPRAWSWGALHTVTFENQSLGQSGIPPIEWLFNRGSYRTGGSASVPNATAWDASEGFTTAAHPSMRMVVDFSDLDTSTWIHSTGQSGHTFHPNYVDLAQDWADVRTYPMPWTRDAVESLTTHWLMLVPEV
ncbi:MAG: penicillin acylase family protein, partial [Acidimicrobiia bacterium]